MPEIKNLIQDCMQKYALLFAAFLKNFLRFRQKFCIIEITVLVKTRVILPYHSSGVEHSIKRREVE